MSDDWLVRPATVDDLAACARLIASHEGGAVAEWREHFAGRLSAARGGIWVAVSGGEVVGYGRMEHHGGSAVPADPPLPAGYYLSGIVVAQAHRRRGIGRSLCHARIAWVASRADDVWFFTNRRNDASRRLHRLVGFAEVGEFTSPHLDGGQGVLGHRRTGGPLMKRPSAP